MMQRFNIIGHRGYGPTDNMGVDHVYPENTLKAFTYALDNGADGIELDVFLSKDGKPIVIHDRRLYEHVVPEQAESTEYREVGSFTYSELQKFDLRQRQKIPTLQDVFKMVSSYRDSKIINLDVKDSKSINPILKALKEAGSGLKNHKIIISSYDWDILREFRKHDKNIKLVPAIKSVLLFGAGNVEHGTYKPLTDKYMVGFEDPVIGIHKEIQAYAFDCAIPDFTPQLIEFAKSQGVGLQLSTGNERVSAEDMDYKTLQILKESTSDGVPFVICKVDEPKGVIKKMAL